MNNGILSIVGNTPLVKLIKMFKDTNIQVFAKLESLNPGGSVKDRPALNIIRHGIEMGQIGPDTVVIESSSGNMGIGLAQACSFYGLRFICVVDAKTTIQNLRLLKVYGAEVDVVSQPDPVTGEYLQARIKRVEQLYEEMEDGFWPNQYANTHNAESHHRTMREIIEELPRLDYLFCATSTCGTLRGCAEYIMERYLDTKIIAVDAIGSVIFGSKKAKRLIPGHGAALTPRLFDPSLADRCIHVSDLDCVVGCRRLVKEEAILAGGSSGAVLMALEQIKDELPANSICAVIFPDRGERYLDTIYSDKWVQEHFGDVAHLWATPRENQKCMTTTY